ncbi:SUMF1/EgtB/PvdO family nonheme iron enzyme [Devosia sp.]|uniref:SUMF1/EgtB/PvdO family nonheme iron enzyme n=1 Tax=Devosia sp. TaxID=1871048 RepID=UPI002EFB3951
MTYAVSLRPGRSLWLPAVLLAALLAAIAGQTGLPDFGPAPTLSSLPETVLVPARDFTYSPAGTFQQEGIPVDAPPVTVRNAAPLEIMTYQVSLADYGRCVADGACVAPQPRRRPSGNVPVTGVSFEDASAYAAWLSRATGQTWRLPSEAEWVQAAGSRFVDDRLGVETDIANPAERWLARYRQEAARAGEEIRDVLPLGGFGSNEFGVADMAGSVWEWTSTCDGRTTLDASGAVVSRLASCGVRILEGRHRTGMSMFVRDARGGACSFGAPPDNLGFRLVRERKDAWPFGLDRLFG